MLNLLFMYIVGFKMFINSLNWILSNIVMAHDCLILFFFGDLCS